MSTVKPLSPLSSGLVTPTGAEAMAPSARASGGGVQTDPTREVLSQLAAGQISANDAVTRLAAAVTARSGATEAGRLAVEQQVRQLLETDPTVGALLARLARG